MQCGYFGRSSFLSTLYFSRGVVCQVSAAPRQTICVKCHTRRRRSSCSLRAINRSRKMNKLFSLTTKLPAHVYMNMCKCLRVHSEYPSPTYLKTGSRESALQETFYLLRRQEARRHAIARTPVHFRFRRRLLSLFQDHAPPHLSSSPVPPRQQQMQKEIAFAMPAYTDAALTAPRRLPKLSQHPHV